MRIHLHAGAHKTATTWLQSMLADSLAGLNESGVGYMPLERFRRSVTQNLMSTPPAELRPQKMLQRFFPTGIPADIRGVVISDENLIGTCGGFIRSGHLYRDAGMRLRRLRKVLAGNHLTLFFAIRSYDTFIPSAYCEVLRHAKAFVPFEDFRPRIALDQSRWPLVLSRMIKTLQPAGVVVWRYEDFRANADAIARMLAFDIDLRPESRTSDLERPSFSQIAVDVLGTIAERHGPAVAASLVNPVGDGLPKGEEHKGFDPWNDDERAELRRLYEADCAELPVPLLVFDRIKPFTSEASNAAGERRAAGHSPARGTW